MFYLQKYSDHSVRQGALWKSDGTSRTDLIAGELNLHNFQKTMGFSLKMSFDLKKQILNLEVIQFFSSSLFLWG